MGSRFSAVEVDDSAALAFWEDSPHASVFTHPQVLSALSHDHRWWLALKGDDPVCLWPVALDDTGSVVRPSFSYFVGPMWSSMHADRPAHRGLSDAIEAYGCLLAGLVEQFGEIHADLLPGVDDVRPFDWWNYRDDASRRIRIQPRYTARIGNLLAATDDSLTTRYRELRRRELKRVERAGEPAETDTPSAQAICDLYGQVLATQDLETSAATFSSIRQLHTLVGLGHGTIIAYSTTESQTVDSLVLLLVARGVANMVLNLTDPSLRSSGLNTWTITRAIRAARDAGCDTFDFNGANSPMRGDDKHSYGATHALYFGLDYTGGR